MPKLSIVIPTKNRQKYCKSAINHILSYADECFELVIQDNSDENLLLSFVSNIDDSRLVYSYTNEEISSVENMSRAIGLAKGDYVCMIGDDDTVLPSIFEYTSFMEENQIDSISSQYIPEYFWPNEGINSNGRLTISKYRNLSGIEEVDVKERLKNLFRNGIINYQKYFLPRVYHGIVSKKILDKVYAKVGSYFSGLSPDIYSTVAISSVLNKHYVVADALTVGGACPESTASQSRLGSHKGEYADMPHLKHNEGYEWDPLIPKFYSVETIWAETAIKAAKDFELEQLISDFNQNVFRCAALSRNRDIMGIVFAQYFSDRSYSRVMRCKYICCSYFYQLANFISRGMNRVLYKKTLKRSGISSIEECVKFCE